MPLSADNDLEAHDTHSPESSSHSAPDRKTTRGPTGNAQLSGEPESYAGETESTEQPVSTSWVIPNSDSNNHDLVKLISTLFDPEERKFFYALDEELARIVRFYEEREQEAIERLSTLVTQLTELAEHRREFKAQTNKVVRNQGLSRIFSSVPRTMGSEEIQRARLNAQHINKETQSPSAVDAGDKRRAEAMEHVQALNIGALQPNAQGSETSHKAHDPVQYKAARKKLRTAVIENHRALEILNNYRILNRTGFTKILKKFDKTLDVETMHPYYEARVMPTALVQSETIPKLIHATEGVLLNTDLRNFHGLLRAR